MKTKSHPAESNAIHNTQNDVFWNSKLACAIKLKPWMNELIVSQVRQRDPYQHLNTTFYADGEAGRKETTKYAGEFMTTGKGV